MASFDVVLQGGRVIDPDSGLDGVRNVGITGRSVAAVTEDRIDGVSLIDVAGLVVAPGFIDLHSHAQTLAGRRLQACDGVTAALDLEAGRTPIAAAYALEEANGSPIHYGFSASWASVRMRVLTGAVPDGTMAGAMNVLSDSSWRGNASKRQLDQILGYLSADVAGGAVGIGLLIGYAPGVDPDEYLAVARLASKLGVPTFSHCRDLVEVSPRTRIDGAQELVRAAAETGAHMHYCHVNSTSGPHLDRVLGLIDACRAEGGRVTTEAYPYGRGSTAIGASFLAPDRLAARGLEPTDLTLLSSGERVVDVAQLNDLRGTAPDALVLVHFFDEDDPADQATLRRALTFEGAIVASDAMPLVPTSDQFDPERWPIGAAAVTHPRTAGCFSRSLRLWREEGTPWTEAIRRCTILPAGVLEASCPALRTKGRVQAGADADLVVFDPERVTDRASYEDSTRPSSGIEHVFVDGVAVVRGGHLVFDARPGKALRGEPA